MATDMFIKIDDFKGECTDAKHKDEIEVLSWSWGMTQSGTSHAGPGSGAGKVQVQDITFVKQVDKATPNLIKLCCSGKHFSKARLTIRKAGGTAVEYVKLELSDGLVSGISYTNKQGDEQLTENVTLNFASFKLEYTPQTATGAAGASIPAQWNIAKNAES
jgi:type VI secretion system secreted protein Hcp